MNEELKVGDLITFKALYDSEYDYSIYVVQEPDKNIRSLADGSIQIINIKSGHILVTLSQYMCKIDDERLMLLKLAGKLNE